MRKSGKTPLFRAKRLEKRLEVGEIYIKLEGANPTGHLQDRLAEMVTMEAKRLNSKELLVMAPQRFTHCIGKYLEGDDIKTIVPVFKNEKWKLTLPDAYGLLDFSKHHVTEAFERLSGIADESSAHFVHLGKNTAFGSELVTDELLGEVLERIQSPVSGVFVQPDEGFSIGTCRRSLYKHWIKGKTSELPALYKAVLSKKPNEPIDETTVLVSDESVKEASKLLKSLEGINFSNQGALAFGGFYQMARMGALEKGVHVIVMVDGKTEVQIDNVNDFDEVSKRQLIAYTREWLAQYADSNAETEDAIVNANEKGFILLASRGGQYEGVCIVVHTGFENFIPTYHLAYIGTHASTKGRGVGTELIHKAIELTDGNLSLHVDLDNKGAKKLYEKMGFIHKYNRMLYNG